MKYLICGFSGAGKSTLLKKIKNDSQYKDYEFFDLDNEILQRSGFDTISELVAVIGWEEFRLKEQEILNDLLKVDNRWIALGGGSLTDTNAKVFQNDSSIKVYFLDTPIEVCLQRINVSNDRPLKSEGEDFLRKLYHQRLPIYQKFERILDT